MERDTSPVMEVQAGSQLPKERIAALGAAGAALALVGAGFGPLLWPNKTGGSAPRPMELMKVSVANDGRVRVDSGEITQRSAYAPTQAVPYLA